MKRQYILAGVTMLFASLFISCSQEDVTDESFPQPAKEIVFDFEISRTRTITEGKKTFFSDGDQVGIFGLKRGTEEVLHDNLDYHYLASSKTWTAESSITFPIDGSDLNFYAYYPYVAGIRGVNFEFAVAQDQSEEDGYSRSDFLSAKNETSQVDDKSITLSFVHQFARVEAEITVPQGEVIKSVDICAKKTAVIDLAKQSVTVKPDEAAEYITMQPAGERFRAVIPAQDTGKGKLFRITAESGATYWYKTVENIALPENEITVFSIDCTNPSF